MTKVNFSYSIQITGGPTIARAFATNVDAYDKIELTLDPGAADVVVDVQPGAASQVGLLALSSSLNDDKVTYKVTDGVAADKGPFTLDAPQLFSGGAIAAIGVAPKTLKFSNAHPAGDPTKKATIEIFVGRDATP
jgi:hypothetical protein